MAVLTGIEPEPVFRYFEEICGIPHGSGSTKQISDYCVDFAREHGLRYVQDEMNNVILWKDGTPGYEQSAPVMIQGHLDMVCEKTPERAIDFAKDGLSLRVENGIISADGTTLGGDDGIAVACALAILDSEDIPHPPLEVVLTVDEEVGMLGAAALDCSPIKSRILLNIDSEDEGILLASCAGGTSVKCCLSVTFEEAEGTKAMLALTGLTGGHSGVEIDKGRANANQLLGRALNELGKRVSFSLISVAGGLKDNAIPWESRAELAVAPSDAQALRAWTEKYNAIFRDEYRVSDPKLSLAVDFKEDGRFRGMDPGSKDRVVAALVGLPGGIQRMSSDIPGLVQTSLNMGILETAESEVRMCFAVRSSVGTEKDEVVSRLENFMGILGGSTQCSGDYPAWEYKRESRLRDLMVEIFEEQYGKKPAVEAIHAGLECGLFAGKIPDLDCISFGPDVKDIHTTSERMVIESVQRTWKYILEILRRLV